MEADDIVRMVAAAFGLPHDDNKASLLIKLEQFLLACHKQGKRTLLLVDEVQNLPMRSVEELRMLSNFQFEEKPLLQSFLLGQPEFRRTLQSPSLEQLRQRVIASCHLGPIVAEETSAYIMHRMRMVGWRGDPSFTPDAIEAIHRNTGGIPRKINLLCDRILLMGRLDKKHEFTVKDVTEVNDELQEELAPANLFTEESGQTNAV